MKTKNNQFLYLSDKLDIIDQRLDDVEKVLIAQESNLVEHMRRTALLEKEISPLNKFMYGAMAIISFIILTVSIYAAVK